MINFAVDMMGYAPNKHAIVSTNQPFIPQQYGRLLGALNTRSLLYQTSRVISRSWALEHGSARW